MSEDTIKHSFDVPATNVADINCCKYCRFMRLFEYGPECHKNPPTGHWGPQGDELAFTGEWPVIDEGDWCGCFDGNKEWDRLTEERKPAGHFESTQEMIRKYKETL